MTRCRSLQRSLPRSLPRSLTPSLRRSLPLSLALVALAAAPGGAEPRTSKRTGLEATVHGGVQAPIFFVYDRPGALAGATVAWPRAARLQAVAVADLGLLAAPGLRRATSAATAGMQWWPLADRLWLRLGAGGAAYRERIGVVLAENRMRAIDHGAALVGAAAVGVRLVGRWQVAARFDAHLLGTRGMDYAGTAAVTVGRGL